MTGQWLRTVYMVFEDRGAHRDELATERGSVSTATSRLPGFRIRHRAVGLRTAVTRQREVTKLTFLRSHEGAA